MLWESAAHVGRWGVRIGIGLWLRSHLFFRRELGFLVQAVPGAAAPEPHGNRLPGRFVRAEHGRRRGQRPVLGDVHLPRDADGILSDSAAADAVSPLLHGGEPGPVLGLPRPAADLPDLLERRNGVRSLRPAEWRLRDRDLSRFVAVSRFIDPTGPLRTGLPAHNQRGGRGCQRGAHALPGGRSLHTDLGMRHRGRRLRSVVLVPDRDLAMRQDLREQRAVTGCRRRSHPRCSLGCVGALAGRARARDFTACSRSLTSYARPR
jgi:hypothetical protein